jgi:SAM-dependent methyltransferase
MDAIAAVHERGAGSIVDVGCGTGEFLLAAKERGWESKGVEPIEKEAAFARERGLDVQAALLEESDLPQGSFDVVAALHVLEHVPAPADFLRSIARWARPGGLVAIEVPNFDSRLRRRSHAFGGWRHLRPLEHITHFTPGTLRQAFERAGLEPVRITSPSYVGPPQSLPDALDDLVRRRWMPGLKLLPRPVMWRALRAFDRYDDRRASGMVVFGIARVPGSS